MSYSRKFGLLNISEILVIAMLVVPAVYLFMLEHGEFCDVCRLPEDGDVFCTDPVEEVVVLAAPSVKQVGEPVDRPEEIGPHGCHPSEILTVLQSAKNSE